MILRLAEALRQRNSITHLPSPAGHAGGGGVRNRAISDRICPSIWRGTATSTIWKVR
jgi:hypothetical protein